MKAREQIKPDEEAYPLLSGNTSGLKASDTRNLEKLSKRKTAPDSIISPELARTITELSAELNRQIGLLIDRRGRISAVVVGTRDPFSCRTSRGAGAIVFAGSGWCTRTSGRNPRPTTT